MHVKTPTYIPWSQYDDLMKQLPETDSIGEAAALFQSAKVKYRMPHISTNDEKGELLFNTKVVCPKFVFSKTSPVSSFLDICGGWFTS